MSAMYHGGDPTPPDEICPVCKREFEAHSIEQDFECSLALAMRIMPQVGFRILTLNIDGDWQWRTLDEMDSSSIYLVKMAIMDGKVLEDLG